MRWMGYFVPGLLLIIYGASTAGAQALGPPAGLVGDKVPGYQSFASLEGRFSIALPELSGFGPLSLPAPGGTATGEYRNWKVGELSYQVSYFDLPDSMPSVNDRLRVLEGMTNGISKGLSAAGGRLISSESISLNDSPGREFRFEHADHAFVIVRAYMVKNRMYIISAQLPQNRPSDLDAAVKTLNSFTVIKEDDAAAARRKQIADATPSPLPQGPVVSKLKSDAEDEGLKGHVKSILVEDEDRSGTWSVKGRKRSNSYEFDSRGNLTGETLYDDKGNPLEIIAYGYIDGARVSMSKTVGYDYDPPPPMALPGTAPTSKHDPRYSTKYEYLYDSNGNLLEQRRYMNDGKLSQKGVYVLKGAQREESWYNEKGGTTRHEILLLDDKGNPLEKTEFNAKDGSIRERHRYRYELDSTGNWINKVVEKWNLAKNAFEPGWVEFRSIQYY